ncbi:MAG: IS66 family transposase [Deltaproteobacteria bacterium]|nr:IS66 family transposase [Deltaproteobacteria bacterium]
MPEKTGSFENRRDRPQVQEKQLYVWVFESSDVVIFEISNRASLILEKRLGIYWAGVFVSDRYCGYIKYSKDKITVLHQFCMAHLKRDFIFCKQYDLNRPDVLTSGSSGKPGRILSASSATFSASAMI